MLFTVVQKIAQYLGHFCQIICSQKLSKIAQSGHTVPIHPLCLSLWLVFPLRCRPRRFSLMLLFLIRPQFYKRCSNALKKMNVASRHFNDVQPIRRFHCINVMIFTSSVESKPLKLEVSCTPPYEVSECCFLHT